MNKIKLGTFAIGFVLGVAMLAAPSSANGQCPYSTGFGRYSAPTYGYSPSYYAPSYGYSQGYYGGGGGFYDIGRPRLRRALVVAAVAGAAIAIANDDDDRNRSRSRRRY